jgi:DnaJ homolog subfamily C member 9
VIEFGRRLLARDCTSGPRSVGSVARTVNVWLCRMCPRFATTGWQQLRSRQLSGRACLCTTYSVSLGTQTDVPSSGAKGLRLVRTQRLTVSRSAYMQKALREHPDKGGDADRFKALTVAYDVLRDPERRKLYDSEGDIDEGGEDSHESSGWDDYWRARFQRVSEEDVRLYKERYVGSAEEAADARGAYLACSGDLGAMMERIIAEDDEAEHRVVECVRGLIESGELDALGDFADVAPRGKGKSSRGASKHPKAKRGKGGDPLASAIAASSSRRKDLARSERAEAEAAAKELGLGDGGMDGLKALIAQRGAARRGDSVLASLASRHGVDLSEFDEATSGAFGRKRRR